MWEQGGNWNTEPGRFLDAALSIFLGPGCKTVAPGRLDGSTSGSAFDCMLIFGGKSVDSEKVWCYNPSENKWVVDWAPGGTPPNAGTELMQMRGARIGSTLYMSGGMVSTASTAFDKTWSYTLSGLFEATTVQEHQVQAGPGSGCSVVAFACSGFGARRVDGGPSSDCPGAEPTRPGSLAAIRRVRERASVTNFLCLPRCLYSLDRFIQFASLRRPDLRGSWPYRSVTEL
ncbi:unnamed protein product [Symbiodinium natans]|uniref:Uncharacterized protein n=1 Tax=Symbiodinium natans TaxID=878477 RepID=A0A812SW72_9DINO|nr:unnamed protein product [Symbiodinium natans]